MNDDMALFLICIAIILYFIYRYSKRGGSYTGEVPVGPGTHRIGEDLAPGKCDVVASSGSGEISISARGDKKKVTTIKLAASSLATPARYRNLTLQPHDLLTISGNLQLLFSPPSAITDGQEAELTLGVYRFGSDLPPAKYDLTALAGDGKISLFGPKETDASVSQEMAFSSDGKTSSYQNLLCEEGGRLEISGTLKLKLTKSKKQRGRMQKILDFLNQDP